MTKIRAHSGCEAEDGYHLTMTFVLADQTAAARFLLEMIEALAAERVPVETKPVYVTRDSATRMVSAIHDDPADAVAACEPGQEVVDASTATVVARADAPPRPGMDPRAVLDYFDRQYQQVTTQVAGSISTYAPGGRYDGVEIVKVQTSLRQGFGILTLADGTKVKYELRTGRTLEVKNAPPPPAGTQPGDLIVEPTSRQSGAGAPRSDAPTADVHGTPLGQVPDWMVPIVEATSLRDALQAAMVRVQRADVAEWAMAMAEQIPTIRRVDAASRAQRIERVLSLIDNEVPF